ncbi:MAG: AbrB/MazE/SpoVT family DNA-binding domain-containing protein [Candidatus Bathyarchaeia archaeon]
MAGREEPDVVVVSSKGQIVIPQRIRERLGIKPKSKLLAYSYRGAIIMKKLEVPDIEKELRDIYREVNERIDKYGELTWEEIQEEIEGHRRTRRKA